MSSHAIALKTSSDGGTSWTKNVQLLGISPSWNPHTFPPRGSVHNPTALWDEPRRQVVLHFVEGADLFGVQNGTTWQLRSTDFGRSFLPRERVDANFPPGYRGIYPGPGAGIVLRSPKSKHPARLVFPAFVFRGPNYYPTLETTLLYYSDDGAQTFHLSASKHTHQRPNDQFDEAAVVERADGSLLLSTRGNYSMKNHTAHERWPYRMQAFSTDAGETFGEFEFATDLPDPSCQASLLSLPPSSPLPGKPLLAFCNPANASSRQELTVRTSSNGGETWDAGQLIWKLPSAYSSMALPTASRPRDIAVAFEQYLTTRYDVELVHIGLARMHLGPPPPVKLKTDDDGRVPPAWSGQYNVREFGAKGDGVSKRSHSNSSAIQRALDSAASATVAVCDGGSTGPLCTNSEVPLYSMPTVLIPPGHYVIGATLKLPGGGDDQGVDSRATPRIEGVGRPVLQAQNSSMDIVFGSAVWKWRIQGVQLFGGRNQLHIGNNNSGYGQIIINDCQFQGARGAAVRLLEPSRDLQPPTVGMPPELRGEPHHTLRQFRGSFSTLVTIRDCEFVHCAQALINWADWTHMEDCWLNSYTPYMKDRMAVLENHDRLFLSNILGVPGNLYKQCDPDNASCPDLRWIDNYSYRSEGGQVIVRDFRFGGEEGRCIFPVAPLANSALTTWRSCSCRCFAVRCCHRWNDCGRQPRSLFVRHAAIQLLATQGLRSSA
jgi:hypothetical protein